MPTCPQCHEPCEPEDKFCGHCGQNLRPELDERTQNTQFAIDAIEVKYRLGIVYFKKGRLTNAIELWKQVLTLDPDHSGAQDMLKQAEEQSRSENREDA